MATMEEMNELELDITSSHNAWGIDKKIPVALILVVVFQTVAITWGAATLSSDVKNDSIRTLKLETTLASFIDKSEDKFVSRTTHKLDKENAVGEINDIKSDIKTLEARIRYLETHIK